MGHAPPTLRAGLDDPFYLRVFCDVWLSQHITPHSCCVQWCIWDKSSSRSSLYHSLHLILCFSICHIQASQKVASAHSGWWGWGSPGGSIHTPHVWPGRGWGASAQPGPQGGSHSCHSPQQEAGSKTLKTPKGLVGIFTYSMAIGGFSQQEKPQVCKKRKNSKKAAGTKSGFSSGCNTESRTAWMCLDGAHPHGMHHHTHGCSRAASVTHSQLQTALLSRWDALGMGCTHNSP